MWGWGEEEKTSGQCVAEEQKKRNNPTPEKENHTFAKGRLSSRVRVVPTYCIVLFYGIPRAIQVASLHKIRS